MKARICAAAVAVVLVGGCASSPSSSPASSLPSASLPSASASARASSAAPATSPSRANPTSQISPLPTLGRPSGPPDEPTDRINTKRWVVGTVTSGGSGPCYSLITDDGTRYALHATDGTKLVKGARMRINTRPSRLKINCGPGRLVEMIAAEPLR